METQELFEILPPGFFTTPEQLQDFIDQEGVDDLYQLVPKETFPTLEDFQVSLKKKRQSRNKYGVTISGWFFGAVRSA